MKLASALGKVMAGHFTCSRGVMVARQFGRRLLRGIGHDALVRLLCGSLWFPMGVRDDMSSCRVAPRAAAAARARWRGDERQGGPTEPSGWRERIG